MNSHFAEHRVLWMGSAPTGRPVVQRTGCTKRCSGYPGTKQADEVSKRGCRPQPGPRATTADRLAVPRSYLTRSPFRCSAGALPPRANGSRVMTHRVLELGRAVAPPSGQKNLEVQLREMGAQMAAMSAAMGGLQRMATSAASPPCPSPQRPRGSASVAVAPCSPPSPRGASPLSAGASGSASR